MTRPSGAPHLAADEPVGDVCGLPAGWAGKFPVAGGAGGESAVQRAGGGWGRVEMQRVGKGLRDVDARTR
jgi:hypothetical protein